MSTFDRSFITVVSGLPRSGTSMMMQMLDAGGLAVKTDCQRAADEDNLKGYYELEAVKRTRHDCSWVRDAVGKAAKVIYVLLKDLPADYRYRVIFMQRDIDEVVRSQSAMLARRGERGAGISDREMADTFRRQLARCATWMAKQPHWKVLDVEYRTVVKDPLAQANRVCDFLGVEMDVDAMASAVDPALYRQRQLGQPGKER